jgi:hypothetical protein
MPSMRGLEVDLEAPSPMTLSMSPTRGNKIPKRIIPLFMLYLYSYLGGIIMLNTAEACEGPSRKSDLGPRRQVVYLYLPTQTMCIPELSVHLSHYRHTLRAYRLLTSSLFYLHV